METNTKSRYSILNAMVDQIAIVDKNGYIVFINKSWVDFIHSNEGSLMSCGIGVNYFSVCGDEPEVVVGLRRILSGAAASFQLEYPCHSPYEKRWFLLQIAPIESEEQSISGAIISHINITKRKSLELRLRKLAVTDTLTSLYNRRFFIKKLNEEIVRSKRYSRTLSLILIDIDHFKSINDTYGHKTGDNAIRELSFLIQECVRETDICARLGGDEFVILLPETDQTQLKNVAERMMSQVRLLKLYSSEQEPIYITVSIGAICISSMTTAKQMLEMVDKALYHSKNNGRDQVSYGE